MGVKDPNTKEFAIIKDGIVVNSIILAEADCVTEEAGNAFVQSLGFIEGKDSERPESPTPGNIGDQFNRELGRFQDDPNATPDPLEDTTKEWFYNNDGRWEVRDVQEGA